MHDSEARTEAQENSIHIVEHQHIQNPTAERRSFAIGEEAHSETENHLKETNFEGGRMENSGEKEEPHGEQLVLQAQEIQARIQALVDANELQERDEAEHTLPEDNTKNDSSKQVETITGSSTSPRVNAGMKWGDFPSECEDVEQQGAAEIPAGEAEELMESGMVSTDDAAVSANDEEVEGCVAPESPSILITETERSLNPSTGAKDSTSDRDEIEVLKEQEKEEERLDNPVGEGTHELINPLDNVVFRAQKPLESLLAVSDSQVRSGVWRRITGGRTSRELATGELTNMEGLELELANLIDEDPLQVAILPNILLNKNYSSQPAKGEEILERPNKLGESKDRMEGEAAEEKEHPPDVGDCLISPSPLELPVVEGQVDATDKLSTEE
ncbi:hypothetical protein R1sor_013084 [Riccia sorocarpa]|uniref:Uncharacterized protein n=1 Tax=Riccia sorocarpa TaxID=122646 RepID=A0ABD3H5H6_9MARC